jgi:predicted TIM-barrel fold metal-dependent hydrolase
VGVPRDLPGSRRALGVCMPDIRLISADSHVVEPPDLWERYLEPAFRARAPRVERRDGSDYFVCEDRADLPMGLLGSAGRARERQRREGTYAEDVHRGGFELGPRLADLDLDGVFGEVLYPSLGLGMYQLTDPAFQWACLDAYNRWLADFAAGCAERLRPVLMVSLADVARARDRVLRAREEGFAGCLIEVYPNEEMHYPAPELDPFWAAVQERELPVSLHLGSSRRARSEGRRSMATVVTDPVWAQKTIAEMIFGGLFERFPRLKIVSVENDAGWAPFLMEKMDVSAVQHKNLHPVLTTIPPSEAFRRHIALTFMRDRPAIALRQFIGVENLLWSSDYPHNDSTWPRSRDITAEYLDGVPEDERRLILGENAARLYRF